MLRRAFHLWPAALLLAGSLSGQGAAGETRVFSSRFGLRTNAQGELSVQVFGVDRAVARTISLGGAMPVFGPGEVFALIEPDGAAQRVRIVDSSGETLTRFSIRADRVFALGARSHVIRPFAEHAAMTAFELEFVDSSGRPLRSEVRSDLVLVHLELQRNGHWVAYAWDRAGDQRVLHYDDVGRRAWEFTTRLGIEPTVGISPDGSRSAVGVLQEGGQVSRLHWLDATGVIVATRDVPAFHLAVFAPDAGRLVLAGQDFLGVADPSNGELLWSETSPLSFPLGNPLGFSRDGRHLFALVRRGGPDGWEPLTLLRLEDVGGNARAHERTATEIPEGTVEVSELREEADGSLTAVTRTSVWSLRP